ncbi:MAG: hypothetical protein ACFFC6_02010 [Promethearchaeota archaeon]
MADSSPGLVSKMFQKYQQLVYSVRSDPILGLVIFQFTVLGMIGITGFIGWWMALTFELVAPGYLNYIADHLEHWTDKFIWWGVLSLCVGIYKEKRRPRSWIRFICVISRIHYKHACCS